MKRMSRISPKVRVTSVIGRAKKQLTSQGRGIQLPSHADARSQDAAFHKRRLFGYKTNLTKI